MKPALPAHRSHSLGYRPLAAYVEHWCETRKLAAKPASPAHGLGRIVRAASRGERIQLALHGAWEGMGGT